jgi:hypothetical protein
MVTTVKLERFDLFCLCSLSLGSIIRIPFSILHEIWFRPQLYLYMAMAGDRSLYRLGEVFNLFFFLPFFLSLRAISSLNPPPLLVLLLG